MCWMSVFKDRESTCSYKQFLKEKHVIFLMQPMYCITALFVYASLEKIKLIKNEGNLIEQ